MGALFVLSVGDGAPGGASYRLVSQVVRGRKEAAWIAPMSARGVMRGTAPAGGQLLGGHAQRAVTRSLQGV